MRWVLLLLVLASPGWAARKVIVDAPPKVLTALKAALGNQAEAAALKLPDHPTPGDVRSACEGAGATAAIKAQVAGSTYTVTVFNAADGEPLEAQSFKGPAPAKFKKVPADAAAKLMSALERARTAAVVVASAEPMPAAAVAESAPPAEPAPKAEPPPKADPAPAAEPTPAPPAAEPAPEVKTEPAAPTGPAQANGWTAVSVTVGFRGINRAFAYSADASSTLAGLTMGIAPAVEVDALWYPGAHFTSGLLANLGVYGQGDFVFGLGAAQDGVRFGARSQRFRVGAQLRLPVGARLEVDVHAGYLNHSFIVDPKSLDGTVTRPNLAGVEYSGPRAGVAARLKLADVLWLEAGAAFTFALQTGELGSSSFFPDSKALGIDATAGLVIAPTPGLQLRLGADFANYILLLSSAGLYRAQGANDRYLGAMASVGWAL